MKKLDEVKTMINDIQKLPDKELTDQIINAAIQVHKILGPGFIESAYEKAFCIELDSRNIPYEQQKTIHVFYRGHPVVEHRLDLLIDGHVVVENKSVKDFEAVHFAMVRSYMKAVNASSGLLLNFGNTKLIVTRVYIDLVSPDMPNDSQSLIS